MPGKTEKIRVKRLCNRCLYRWEEYLELEDIKKIEAGEVVSECPHCQQWT